MVIEAVGGRSPPTLSAAANHPDRFVAPSRRHEASHFAERGRASWTCRTRATLDSNACSRTSLARCERSIVALDQIGPVLKHFDHACGGGLAERTSSWKSRRLINHLSTIVRMLILVILALWFKGMRASAG